MKQDGVFLENNKLDLLFPFYFSFNKTMEILACGRSLKKMDPSLMGSKVPEYLHINHPLLPDFSFETMLENKDQIFLVAVLSNSIVLRGQMIYNGGSETLMFVGSPHSSDLGDLDRAGLQLRDFAIHDASVELLHVIKAQENIIEGVRTFIKQRDAQKQALIQLGDALRKSEEKYRGVIENMQLGLLEVDLNDIIVYPYDRFCEMTGYDREELIGKDTFDLLYNTKKNKSRLMLQNIRKSQGKTNLYEIQIHKKNGEAIWVMISEAPLYDEDHEFHGAICIYSDITERKEAEVALMKAKDDANLYSTRLTNSINYSQKIQKLILPNPDGLKNSVKEMFTLSLPKDIVSGDFPLFYASGDTIYIGAVDCTGHGVPGAMLSLISTFLLNDILKTEDQPLPSVVLKKLHYKIVSVLKQGVDGNDTSDGLDIGLCAWNTVTGQVKFAGAHRPLFQIRNEVLVEYKGTRLPVGGTNYRKEIFYPDTTIDVLPGDRFFVFSDGLGDQFGGPENEKFSMERIREFLLTHFNVPMNALKKALEKEFYDWKGSAQQIDDVLFIGFCI
jgi:PAS domain S-box-containing protein